MFLAVLNPSYNIAAYNEIIHILLLLTLYITQSSPSFSTSCFFSPPKWVSIRSVCLRASVQPWRGIGLQAKPWSMPSEDLYSSCTFHSSVFVFLMEFIGVTSVNKIIQVSGVQFYNTSSVYYIVFTTPSQVSFHHHLSPPLYPLLPLPHPFPLVILLPVYELTAIRSYLKKLKMELPYDPGVPLLGVFPKKSKTLILKNILVFTPMLILALFTIVKIQKQPKCPSVHERIKHLWYMYTVEYYSAVKSRKS